jgi:transcriptional regulator with XRE-family HTH domain
MTTALIECFGMAVRQSREAQGWSQEGLAERSDLNRSYVGEIERGRVVVSLLTVEKLAVALDVSPSSLVKRGEAVGQTKLALSINLMAIAC